MSKEKEFKAVDLIKEDLNSDKNQAKAFLLEEFRKQQGVCVTATTQINRVNNARLVDNADADAKVKIKHLVNAGILNKAQREKLGYE